MLGARPRRQGIENIHSTRFIPGGFVAAFSSSTPSVEAVRSMLRKQLMDCQNRYLLNPQSSELRNSTAAASGQCYPIQLTSAQRTLPE